jgi:hypothetical protein
MDNVSRIIIIMNVINLDVSTYGLIKMILFRISPFIANVISLCDSPAFSIFWHSGDQVLPP